MGKNEFFGKKRKRHSLTFPNTKLHAKNQKNLSRGFPGKQGETDRQTETDPNIRVLRTLSLCHRTKNGMEAKGLRVDMSKAKVMICEADSNPLKKSGKYPCGVCRSGVGSNSIYCNTCSHWVHKACSGIKGRLKPDPEFTCSRCLGLARPINVQLIKNISIGEDTLDVESSFCYLGDMVSQGGGCLDGITTRIRCAWG